MTSKEAKRLTARLDLEHSISALAATVHLQATTPHDRTDVLIRATTQLAQAYFSFMQIALYSDPFDIEVLRRARLALGIED